MHHSIHAGRLGCVRRWISGDDWQRSVSGGWPRILSNLKSLLETGHVVLKPAADGEKAASGSRDEGYESDDEAQDRNT